jgi:hypothetical protein
MRSECAVILVKRLDIQRCASAQGVCVVHAPHARRQAHQQSISAKGTLRMLSKNAAAQQ